MSFGERGCSNVPADLHTPQRERMMGRQGPRKRLRALAVRLLQALPLCNTTAALRGHAFHPRVGELLLCAGGGAHQILSALISGRVCRTDFYHLTPPPRIPFPPLAFNGREPGMEVCGMGAPGSTHSSSLSRIRIRSAHDGLCSSWFRSGLAQWVHRGHHRPFGVAGLLFADTTQPIYEYLRSGEHVVLQEV